MSTNPSSNPTSASSSSANPNRAAGEKASMADKAQSFLASLDTTLEKAGFGRALNFLNETASGTRKILANERILTQLKRVGVASQEEVDSLRSQLSRLEAEISLLKAQLHK